MGKKFFQALLPRYLEPLTVTAVTELARFQIASVGFLAADIPPLQIRYGSAGAWQSYKTGTLITLNQGEKCQFRNLSENLSTGLSRYLYFSSAYPNDRVIFSGDLMALVNWRKNLPEYIFYRLFYSFKLMTEAPEIPDVPMANNALSYTFAYCSNLNKLRVRFKNWSSATNSWVALISSTGIFYKPSVLPEERGTSKIPNNWQVVNIDG